MSVSGVGPNVGIERSMRELRAWHGDRRHAADANAEMSPTVRALDLPKPDVLRDPADRAAKHLGYHKIVEAAQGGAADQTKLGCRHKHGIEPAHLEAVPVEVNRGRRAHPGVMREPTPELPGGPGRRHRSATIQGSVTKTDPAVVADLPDLADTRLHHRRTLCRGRPLP